MPDQPVKKGSLSTPKKRRESGARRHATLTPEAHRMLLDSSDSLGVTACEYASAAISYFAQRGLDPVKNQEREGIVIQNKISELEKVVNTLGNRLFGWLTQHEKNLNKDLFGFLRGHEKTLFAYLQAQDKNVHEHLADQEEMFLMPLMRELMWTNVEALYSRRLGEQIMLKVLGREMTEYVAKHKEFNERRDVDARKKLDAFVESLAPATQPLATVPQPTPIPQRPISPADTPGSATATSSEKSF